MQTALWLIIGILIGSNGNQEPVEQKPLFTQENKEVALNMLMDNQSIIFGAIILTIALPVMLTSMKILLGSTR